MVSKGVARSRLETSGNSRKRSRICSCAIPFLHRVFSQLLGKVCCCLEGCSFDLLSMKHQKSFREAWQLGTIWPKMISDISLKLIPIVPLQITMLLFFLISNTINAQKNTDGDRYCRFLSSVGSWSVVDCAHVQAFVCGV